MISEKQLYMLFIEEYHHFKHHEAFGNYLWNGCYWEKISTDNEVKKKLYEVAEKNNIEVNDHLVTQTLKRLYSLKATNEEPNTIRALNLLNGTLIFDEEYLYVNFHKDKYFHEYFITHMLNYKYNPDIKSTLIEEFLDQLSCGDKKIRQTLVECLGSVFLPQTTGRGLEKAFFLIGESTSNGKSTFEVLISNIIGYEACSHLRLEDFTRRFIAYELVGKWVNFSHEITNYTGSISLIKSIVTGDPIYVKQKGKPAAILNPKIQLIMDGNTYPSSTNIDNDWIRRILPINIRCRYTRNTEKAKLPNYHLADKKKVDKMMSPREISGLLNIAISGYVQIIRDNYELRY